MECSFKWDGTLSFAEFHASSKALMERWKDMNSSLPPWVWVPSSKFPCGALGNAEGYLSLERVHRLNVDEEHFPEGSCIEEELLDSATLVQNHKEDVHVYDFHVLYSASYKVPVLYFRGYQSDGQLVALENIEKDLPSSSSRQLKNFKWTFITQEDHPYLNRPWFVLHPCGTSDWMKLLFIGSASQHRDVVIQKYLLSWLSVVGQAVGLGIPLAMLK